jgi:hypothetical protein
MAYALCWLAREQGFQPDAEFIALAERAPRIVMRYGGDFSRLTHWGMIETVACDDPTKRTAGMWRATRAGIDFARGLTRVESHVLVYNNESHGLTGERISVIDALGGQFDYSELMGGTT